MWLALLAYQLALPPLSPAQNVCLTHPTFRMPANSDIEVICGTDRIKLQILLCPMYYSGYNETLMALNAQYFKAECQGAPDWTVSSPILKFDFLISDAVNVCSNKLTVTQEVGSGILSDFSSIQFVNISGMVNSLDPSTGIFTLYPEIQYKFSCRYALQYFVKSTAMNVTGVSLIVKDSNGSFISTLSMQLYTDNGYTTLLKVPVGGLELKTRIFVQVKATNLTERFNVMLDRCYATTSPYPVISTYYDLFFGCNRDGQTVMGVNGEQQVARFSFETFRFVQHQNRTLSTFYLHCVTRLCDTSLCSTMRQNCTTNSLKLKRDISSTQGTYSNVATVSSGPISTKVNSGGTAESEAPVPISEHGAVFGVTIGAGVAGALCFTLMAFLTFRMFMSKLGCGEETIPCLLE